jgi:hypothetical protein
MTDEPTDTGPDATSSGDVEPLSELARIPIDVQPGQPVVPPPHVRAEIEELLRNDTSRIGEIFNRLALGHDAEQIRLEFGLERTTFVWSYERMIRALRDGDLPTAPTVAQGVARKFRSILKNARLSDDARLVLSSNLVVLEERASDEANREQETVAALNATEEVESEAISGIYVYALPHYLRYPYDQDSGRTLLKVGRSDRDVIERFRSQTRTTALPEEPVLLRVYPVEVGAPSMEVERTFHRLLEAADHDRSQARTGGTEWFLTSVRFLDEIANTLRLKVREVIDVGDVD